MRNGFRDGRSLVLIATASLDDGRDVERSLAKTGWSVRRVPNAPEAERHLNGGGAPAVLVIDSGLLEMAHDSQWRELRQSHPSLGAVVRCLVAREGGLRRRDATTLLVHPDAVSEMCQGIQVLGGPAFAS